MSVQRYAKLPAADYRYIYSRVPRVCVDIVIRKRGGVLLSRRSIRPHLGKWHLPGGRVYQFETLSHACRRICREELGIRARVLGVLGAIEYLRDRTAPGFTTHSVSVVLAVQPIGGTLRGSWQARKVSFFRSPPGKIMPAVRTFLLTHRLIRR